MTTIIFCHPWHGSFNKAILDTVIAQLDSGNKPYQVIDLYKDKFKSDFTESELALYRKGEFTDPLVGKYQDMIRQSEQLIFIFPIWWATMPAMLKGFFDKVFLVNFSHNYENGWTPLLKMKKETIIITTSQSETEKFNNSIVNVFINQTLGAVGITNLRWLNNPRTTSGDNAHRAAFLQEVEELF
ncbi:NAD(P)H-dependent oxidoreductase [Proteiniphilum sp.]|uniref:NAD(P)H-dependent oxidoreductase n=1 Tax=Proteiniphilum sp. TaxID=1926877 RepID=UPI002B209037|nr:NAD(P)H-dependent oxidoreductase [Proteiniphilum sp.]MEA4916351.1 NAD(P)H-dependent oxidoreductase [Proteiniphilum sp.]MEA4950947.1 NAD(P)H-dependent oxidoreductase [Petrimonas sp.]